MPPARCLRRRWRLANDDYFYFAQYVCGFDAAGALLNFANFGVAQWEVLFCLL